MNTLPASWVETPLETIVTSSVGGIWGSATKGEGGVPVRVVRGAEFRDWSRTRAQTAPRRFIPAAALASRQLKIGDIVLEVSGGGPTQPVGRTALIDSEAVNSADEPLICSNFCRRLVLSSAVSPLFIWYQLQRSYWRGDTDAFQRATTNIRNLQVPHYLAGTRLVIPPVTEQGRIVAVIEEQFSRVDEGVRTLERARMKLGRMRDAIRFAATRGQLVGQSPTEEPAADLIARVKPTGRFRGGGPLPNDLGPLPSGWCWAMMGRLAHRVTVGHVGPMKNEYVSTGVPFLRSQNVREDRFDPRGLLFISPEFHQRLAKSRLFPGDVVIVRSGNVGTACVVPETLGEANCADLVVVQRPEALDPRYAALYMNSLARSRVHAGSVGVALTHFNTQSVAELPVPVPPMAEQCRIVAEADRLMSLVDALEAVVTESLNRVSGLRSSVLVSAFLGKLAPQDPSDEPAAIIRTVPTTNTGAPSDLKPTGVRLPRSSRAQVPS